jgi:hypothetical protein
MTPQHRYLKYEKGTFVFVPADRVDSWAEGKPAADGELAQATRKGYFEPVETKEVASLTNAPASTNLEKDPAWQQKIDRYEARAAMGDANAMAALAQIYRSGLGTKQDPRRANLWATEGRETFSYSKAFNVNDPVAAAMLDTFLGGNGRGVPGGPGISSFSPPHGGGGNSAQAAGMAAFGMQMARIFGGDGGANTTDELQARQREILTDLQRRNYRAALEKLNRWESDLRRVSDAAIAGAKPPEFDQIVELVKKARGRIDLNLGPSATKAVEDAGRLVQELRKQFPASPPKT